MISNFKTFIIQESAKEAKDFVNSLIRKNLLTSVDLNHSKSAFNQIRNLFLQNPGYIGFFVRKFYTESLDEIEKNTTLSGLSIEGRFDQKFPIIESIYANVLELKKYKINLNFQDFQDKSLAEIDNLLQQMIASKNRPGLILNEVAATKPIHNFLNRSNYKVILCVKKHGNEYVPDHQAVLWWGSPSWCIKSQSTFSCSYAKDKHHLQYIFIHNSIFDEVVAAGPLGQQEEVKLVPRNYNLSVSTNYTPSWNHDYRIGCTTEPIKQNTRNPFEHNTNQSYPTQDDDNDGINKRGFAEHISPIKFEVLDMAVRSLINVNKSQFDNEEATLEDLIAHVKINFSNTNDDTLLEYLRKTAAAIKSHINTPLFQKILNEAIDMMRKQPNTFTHLHYLLFFADNIPNDLLDRFKELWSSNLETLPFEYTLGTFQLFLELRHVGKITNPKLIEMFDSLLANRYVDELLAVKNADNLSNNIDFKSVLLKTYGLDKANEDYSAIGVPVNVEKTSKLLTDFLFKYNNEKGKQIIKDRKWDREKDFAETIIQKINNDDVSDSPELESEMKRLIDVHSKTFQGAENLRYVLEEAIESKTYELTYHNSGVKTAMKHYMQKINPNIENVFKTK